VALEENSALPELKQGNEYLRHSEPGTAVEYFARAVAKADANPSLKPDVKGAAHYSYGLGKAMVGDYDVALAELHLAQTLKPQPAWMEFGEIARAYLEEGRGQGQRADEGRAAAAAQ